MRPWFVHFGGDYALYELASGRTIWGSTRWPSFSSPELPPNYKSPFLNWFRGAELEISKTDFQFSLHGFLDIGRKEADSMLKLPSLDMFKGFGDLFGAGGNQTPNEQKPKQKEIADYPRRFVKRILLQITVLLPSIVVLLVQSTRRFS